MGGGVVEICRLPAELIAGNPIWQVITAYAQIDSSMRMTGVNLPLQEPVGCIHKPSGFYRYGNINNFPGSELVSGWCECIRGPWVTGLISQLGNFWRFKSPRCLNSPELEKLLLPLSFKGDRHWS